MSAPAPYDLLVIGSGPAGQKAAIAAAKLGKRVAIVDRVEMIGGVCVHTGTIPSKTLREAILYLTGFRQRSYYGRDYTLEHDITVSELAFRVNHVLSREMEVVQAQLERNHITTWHGSARFLDPHTVEVDATEAATQLKAEHILIACGTRPAHMVGIPFDGTRIIDADQLISVGALPHELIVVGGGIIGLEYASMLSALGVAVTVVEERPGVLEFADQEIVETLLRHMRERGATFHLGEQVVSVRIDERDRVAVATNSAKQVQADALLYAVGRQANSDLLDLAAAGLEADGHGRIPVDEHYRTSVPHIYAAGDVIGFPALASTSMEQGRLASLHMFGQETRAAPHLVPYGIYTIPEISMVGRTEGELKRDGIAFEVGLARYEEIARAQMMGDETGLLKILFDPQTLRPLGIHAIGENATEIIHIGQAVMSLGGTLEYLRDTVFNYPSFAEAYKVAALNGLNKV
jgi:NAD(P) transhydrogenase